MKKWTPGGVHFLFSTEEGAGDPLVQQHGQDGDHTTLDEIQRCHGKSHEGGNVCNGRIDSAAHGNDVFKQFGLWLK